MAAQQQITKIVGGTNPLNEMDVTTYGSTKAAIVSLVDGSGNQIVPISSGGTVVIGAGSNVIGSVNQGTSPWIIQGAAASATTNSGNPTKIAAVMNNTQPTYTDGQVGDLQMSTRGALYTTLLVQNSTTAMRNIADNVDGVTVSSTAFNLGVIGRNTVYNGTSWDRQPGNTVGAFSTIKGGLMPDSTALTTYAIRITTNVTTTPTSSTCYISSIGISTEATGTTSTIKLQDKSGTPLVLVPAAITTTTGLVIYNFQTPIKMTSGIDVITAGAAAATVDVWINYYQ